MCVDSTNCDGGCDECVQRREEKKMRDEVHERAADLSTALQRAEAAEQALEGIGGLLAIIHGDGGHYISEHGWKKAIKDAATKYYAVVSARGTAEQRAKVLAEEVRAYRHPDSEHADKTGHILTLRYSGDTLDELMDARRATDAANALGDTQ